VATQAETLHRELRERNVELLIVGRFGPFADENLGFEILYDDSHVVAAGAQHPWVRRRRIALAELVNESWVLPPPGSASGSVAMQAFAPAGSIILARLCSPFPPEARVSLLKTGRFLTITPASILRFPTRRPDIKVLPVELPLAHVPIGIVTLKNRTLSPVARLLIEYAREVAKLLAKRKW
jgi:DNA-binding transcriptional LysR family regulator